LGPATGGATTGAEGDILFTRWVTSGGYPTIVLSPTDINDSYVLTVHAFNFAEKYRTPVFLLTSKELVFTMETAELDGLKRPPLVERTLAPPDREFIPYRFEKLTDVPEISHYGGPHKVRFTTSMHDEHAYLTKDLAKVDRKCRHLEYKINAAVEDVTIVEKELHREARTLVISYGVTARSARDALWMAKKDGNVFSSLIIKTLYPVPEPVIREALEDVDVVVVPELNLGQYVREIQPLAPEKEIIPINRVDGEIISPEMILEKVQYR
jgi:2-oxoglutarate ferredoxin oxidoreductase subunit alpha